MNTCILLVCSYTYILGVYIVTSYVIGFAKRGLLHTSNSLDVKDHNLAIKQQIEVKLSPVITLCWHVLPTKFQVSTLYQSKVMNHQSW